MAQTAAAGDGHPRDRDGTDNILFEDLGQLLGIIHRVQFGTADQGYTALDEIPVEIAIGKSGAVCGNQQICPLKIRCVDGHQFDLYREIAQTAGYIYPFT